MKTRLQFVSNSSSSSFILIGVESSSEEYESNREFIRKNKLDLVYETDEDMLLGYKIARTIEEDEGGCLDLSELDSMKNILNQISNKPVKIYYGTELC